MHHTKLGILFMIFAQAMYVVIDGSVKLLEQSYPIWQLIFLRSVLGLLPFIIYFSVKNKLFSLTLSKIKDHFPNAVSTIIGTFLILHALMIGELNQVVALSFSVVFFVGILSYVMLREKIELHRWVATVIGFLGVVIIINPNAAIFNYASFVTLLYCPFDAYGMIRGKQLSKQYETSEILFWNLLFCTIISSIGLGTSMVLEITPSAWVNPTPRDFILFIVTGLGSIFAYGLVINAYSRACASIIGPMIYSSMIWSLIFAYLALGEIPSRQLLMGSLIIILSGLYITLCKILVPVRHSHTLS